MSSGIGEGALAPHEILIDGDTEPAKVAAAAGRGRRACTAPSPRRSGAAAAPRSSMRSRCRTRARTPAATTLAGVRDAAHAAGADVRVGGGPASTDDFIDAVYGSFPLMVALIAVTTFLLLARAFRSLLLPLKAILLNVLSVAAAWGVLVLVWQHGYGSELIWGIPATGTIPAWMPLIVFAFLFGLSMDYEVFILSRMREEYDRTGSTRDGGDPGHRAHRPARHERRADPLPRLRRMASGPETDVKMLATGAGGGDPARRDDHPRADRARRDLADGPLELVAAALVGADPAGGAVAGLAAALEQERHGEDPDGAEGEADADPGRGGPADARRDGDAAEQGAERVRDVQGGVVERRRERLGVGGDVHQAGLQRGPERDAGGTRNEGHDRHGVGRGEAKSASDAAITSRIAEIERTGERRAAPGDQLSRPCRGPDTPAPPGRRPGRPARSVSVGAM